MTLTQCKGDALNVDKLSTRILRIDTYLKQSWQHLDVYTIYISTS